MLQFLKGRIWIRSKNSTAAVDFGALDFTVNDSLPHAPTPWFDLTSVGQGEACGEGEEWAGGPDEGGGRPPQDGERQDPPAEQAHSEADHGPRRCYQVRRKGPVIITVLRSRHFLVGAVGKVRLRLPAPAPAPP